MFKKKKFAKVVDVGQGILKNNLENQNVKK